MIGHFNWKFAVRATIQGSTTGFGCGPAPLLEEESDLLIPAFSSELANPFSVNGTMVGPTFSSYYCPRDPCKIYWANRTEQWFKAYESNLDVDIPKNLYSLVVHRHLNRS